MTREELLGLLGYLASVDGRNLTRISGDAWFEIIGHLDAGACRRAITAHYQNNDDWLMPVDIIRRVRAETSPPGPPPFAEIAASLPSGEQLASPQRISEILGPLKRRLALVRSEAETEPDAASEAQA